MSNDVLGPQVFSIVRQIAKDMGGLKKAMERSQEAAPVVCIENVFVFVIGGNVDLRKITDAVGSATTFAGSLGELVTQVAQAFQDAANTGGQEAVDALAEKLKSATTQDELAAATLRNLITPPATALVVAFNGPTSATVGESYTGAFAASGGKGPYSAFSLETGALPDGLSLDPSGAVGGAPTTAGSYSFGVSVSDANGNTASAFGSITVG